MIFCSSALCFQETEFRNIALAEMTLEDRRYGNGITRHMTAC